MPQNDAVSLADALSDAARRPERFIWSAETQVALAELSAGSSLEGSLEELRGRSVLIITRDQLTAALALIQIDGVARRLILCPPDLAIEHLPLVMATAQVDAVVSDYARADIGAMAVSYTHLELFPGHIIGRKIKPQPKRTEFDKRLHHTVMGRAVLTAVSAVDYGRSSHSIPNGPLKPRDYIAAPQYCATGVESRVSVVVMLQIQQRL